MSYHFTGGYFHSTGVIDGCVVMNIATCGLVAHHATSEDDAWAAFWEAYYATGIDKRIDYGVRLFGPDGECDTTARLPPAMRGTRVAR